MKKLLARAAFILAVLFVAPSLALAQLERMGPVSTANGYPTWFQDRTGLALEFCSPLNQAELDAGWCLILPGAGTAPTFPEVFPNPNSFFNEHFYWAAGATTGDSWTGRIGVIAIGGGGGADGCGTIAATSTTGSTAGRSGGAGATT